MVMKYSVNICCAFNNTGTEIFVRWKDDVCPICLEVLECTSLVFEEVRTALLPGEFTFHPCLKLVEAGSEFNSGKRGDPS